MSLPQHSPTPTRSTVPSAGTSPSTGQDIPFYPVALSLSTGQNFCLWLQVHGGAWHVVRTQSQ